MKRVNVKLLIILLVVTAASIVGVYFAHSHQVTKNAGDLLKQAEKAKQEGDLEEAIKLYSRYLRHRPNDLEQYVSLASVASDQAEKTTALRDIQDAYRILVQANLKYRDNPEIRSSLADYSVRFGRFDDAIGHLEFLRRENKADIDQLVLLARCYQRMSYSDKALALCAELVGYDRAERSFDSEKAIAPDQLDAYVLMAAILHEKDRERARAAIERMVEANPESLQAHLRRAEYLQQAGTTEEAKEAVAQAHELAPDDAVVIQLMAAQAIRDRDFSTAKLHYARGLELHGDDERFPRGLAYLALEENRSATAKARESHLKGAREEAQQQLAEARAKLDEATALLDAALKRSPESTRLRMARCEMLVQKQDVKGARVALDELRKQASSVSEGEVIEFQLLEARILMMEGEYRTAAARLEALRPMFARQQERTRQIDLLLGETYERLGQPDKAAQAYRLAGTGAVGGTAAAHAILGAAEQQRTMGKVDEALASYEQIAAGLGENLLTDPRVWRPLLQLRIVQQVRQPEARRDWTRVDELMSRILAFDGLSDSAKLILQAEVLTQKGQAQDALTLLRDAWTKHPDNIGIYTLLLSSTLQQEGLDAAEKMLDQAPEALRDSLAVRLGRVEIAVRRGGEGAREALAAAEQQAETLPENEKIGTWSTLGTFYYGIGDRPKAKQLWSKAAAALPEDLNIRLQLFELAREMDDVDAMRPLAEQIAQISGRNSEQAKVVEAARLVSLVSQASQKRSAAGDAHLGLSNTDKRNLAEARRLLTSAAAGRPGWHEVPKVLAEIEGLEGDADGAIAQFQRALQLGPPEVRTLQRLVRLLHLRGRTVEAEPYLTLLGSRIQGVERIKVDVLWQQGQQDEALELAGKLVPDNSTNADELLWYGQLLRRADKLDEAESMLKRSIDASPDKADAWLALIGHYVLAEKLDEAQRTISEARSRLPDEVRDVTLGQTFMLMGDARQAEQHLQAAIEKDQGNLAARRMLIALYMQTDRLPAARELLEQSIAAQPDSAADLAERVWARRTMAEILARSGDYQETQRALALLSENASEAGLTTQENLVKIRILAARNEPVSWREAVRLLEQLDRQGEVGDADRMTLARLYHRLGRWIDARDQMTRLVGRSEANPDHFAAFIEMLLAHDSMPEAQTWLRQLREANPGHPMLIPLTMRLMVKQGQGPQAAAMLSGLAPRPGAATPQDVPRLRLLGSLLEEIDQRGEAEKLYRQIAAVDADSVPMLARFLAADSEPAKITESLDLIEEASRSANLAPTQILQVGLYAVRNTSSTPEHMRRVQAWFDARLREDPDSVALQLLLAELYDIQGQYSDAERVYRVVLDHSSTSDFNRAVAANNLAFILAMQEKNLTEALQFANRAISYLGPRSDLLDTRGVVYLAAGQVKEALADLTDSVLDPTPGKYLHLAMAQFRDGQRQAARASLAKAQELKLDENSLSNLEREKYRRLVADVGA